MDFPKIFKRTDQPVGRASDWIGVLTFAGSVVGAISWPTSSISTIAERGWGAIFLISLIMTSIFACSIGILLIGYRRLRPLSHTAIFSNSRSAVKYESSNINNEMNELKTEAESLKNALSILSIHIDRKLDDQGTSIRYLENMITGIQENHNELRASMRKALSAQQSKQNFDQITEDIDNTITFLSSIPNKTTKERNWPEWEMGWNRLQSKLKHLARLSDDYEITCKELFAVPSEKFKSHYWSFNDDGMTEDQKHDYKTFRIIITNYREVKSTLNSAILDAAYKAI